MEISSTIQQPATLPFTADLTAEEVSALFEAIVPFVTVPEGLNVTPLQFLQSLRMVNFCGGKHEDGTLHLEFDAVNPNA